MGAGGRAIWLPASRANSVSVPRVRRASRRQASTVTTTASLSASGSLASAASGAPRAAWVAPGTQTGRHCSALAQVSRCPSRTRAESSELFFATELRLRSRTRAESSELVFATELHLSLQFGQRRTFEQTLNLHRFCEDWI